MLLIVACAVGLLVSVGLLARRNEEALRAMWAQLVTQETRRRLEAQIKAEEKLRKLWRERRDRAAMEGRVLEAAATNAQEDAIVRERRRTLSIVRRMLRAR